MTKLIKLPEVSKLTALSRSSIYLKIQNDQFPKPCLLGERGVAWLSNEVENWITERAEKRTGGAA